MDSRLKSRVALQDALGGAPREFFKACLRCGLIKPLVAFALDSTRADDLNKYCRTCHGRRRQDWKRRNAAWVRLYGRIQYSRKKLQPRKPTT